MAKALYRQFRPKTLADVVGQEQVTRGLENALKQGNVSHAYLFIGPRGTGKTSVARIFAHQVNGFSYEIEDSYVDIIEIDGASNRGIDNIRELREKVAIAPTAGKYKVYIIDEVHMLTKEAFNALLKTLEEPPSHAIFIMATTDAHKVPITITSRAQTYIFHLADNETMASYLRRVARQAKIKITDEAIRLIVRRGGGSFRDSLSLLDQLAALPADEITAEEITKALGIPEDDKISGLIHACLDTDFETVAAMQKEILASGVKAETLAEEMIRTIIENPTPEAMPLLARLADVKAPFAEARLLVALAGCSPLQAAGPVAFSSPKILPSANILGVPLQAPPAAAKATVTRHEEPISAPPAAKATVTRHESPVPDQAPAAEPQVTQFDWARFLEAVRGLNDAIYSQLKDAGHTINSRVLEIYPAKKIAKTILSRENNQRILAQAAPGITVKICDKTAMSEKNDELISRISGIMGGEVQNDGGGSPF